jgi:hypothetical protein
MNLYYSDLLKTKEVRNFVKALKELNIPNEDILDKMLILVEDTLTPEVKEELIAKGLDIKHYIKSHMEL